MPSALNVINSAAREINPGEKRKFRGKEFGRRQE